MSSDRHAAKVIRRLRNRIVGMVAATTALVTIIAFAAILAIMYTSSYTEIMRSLVRSCMQGPTNQIVFGIGYVMDEPDDYDFSMDEPNDYDSSFPAQDADQDVAPDIWQDLGGTANNAADENPINDNAGSSGSGMHHHMSTYVPPAAVFVINRYGSIVSSNAQVVAMDHDMRDAAILAALQADRPQGRLPGMGLFFAKMQGMGGTVVAFQDASGLDAAIHSAAIMLLISSLVLIATMATVGALVARFITRPVQQTWDQQSKFIADASHELKTPLTVLIANNDIMIAHPEFTAQERMTWLEGTRVEAQHMRSLIEDMLTLARGEQVTCSELRDLPVVNLSTIVERASLAFEAVAFDRGVQLRENVTPNLQVRGEEDALERMVKTLVDNAVKYAGVGGTASVEVRPGKGGRPVLVVNNTGEPIAKEDLPHVFDRFWRGSKARERSANGAEGGFGLGLSIAHNIAQRHGAKMSVKSDEEHGTTFAVEF